jgi:hypothetical protein
MKSRRMFGTVTLVALCAGLWGAHSGNAVAAGVSDVFVPNGPVQVLERPQDAFMQRIESHLAASSLNYVTAFVTLHTTGWAGNNFSAFSEVVLERTLRGTASYVFSDRLGYPWGTTVDIPGAGVFGPSRAPATMHFDPYQAEGGTLSIDLGYSDTGGVQLGLWGMELTDYTINANDNLIFGYLNGNPDWLAVVSVRLDSHPAGPR